MALRSRLFQGDAKLEAAAVSDDAHIVPGTVGPHVGKIQLALIQLDGANVAQDSMYGAATAAAVLAYKQKRDIVNRGYQTKADNIVGKMTIASLDAEMQAREVIPTGPVRIIPIDDLVLAKPAQYRSNPLALMRVRASTPFVFGSSPVFEESSPLEIPQGGTGRVTVLNGIGRHVLSTAPEIADVINPDDPKQTPVTCTKSSHVMQVVGKARGVADIVVRNNLLDKQDVARLRVFNGLKRRTVTVAFNYLRNPVGATTVRKVGDEIAIIEFVKGVYLPQTNISFQSVGAVPFDTAFRIDPLITLDNADANFGPDWDSCLSKRNNAAMANVFFVATYSEASGVSETRGNTDGTKARATGQRDCMVKDKTSEGSVKATEVVAHELGHCLGISHDQAPGVQELMHSPRTGVAIPSAQAVKMHEHLDKFP